MTITRTPEGYTGFVQDQYFAQGIHQLATTCGSVAAALKNDYFQIEESVRIFVRKNVLLGKDEKRFYGENILFTDPEIFRVFSFHLIKGNVLLAPSLIIVCTSGWKILHTV